jgi:hypothetical protein
MNCLGEAKKLTVISARATTEQLELMTFEFYLNGYKASKTLNGNDFVDWLNVYNIDSLEYTTEKARSGIEIEVPEGIAKWIAIN